MVHVVSKERERPTLLLCSSNRSPSLLYIPLNTQQTRTSTTPSCAPTSTCAGRRSPSRYVTIPCHGLQMRHTLLLWYNNTHTRCYAMGRNDTHTPDHLTLPHHPRRTSGCARNGPQQTAHISLYLTSATTTNQTHHATLFTRDHMPAHVRPLARHDHLGPRRRQRGAAAHRPYYRYVCVRRACVCECVSSGECVRKSVCTCVVFRAPPLPTAVS